MKEEGIVQEAASLARCVFEISSSSGRWMIEERLKWLKNLDKIVIGYRDEILKIVARDLGTNKYSALISEYVVIRGLIQYYRRKAKKILREENIGSFFSLMWGNKKIIVEKIPLGVVGIITPSNSPFSIPLGMIIPAILAGNSVVWKPSPATENTNQFLKNLLRLSFRDFEFSPIEILPSCNPYGEELVKNPEVDRIFFVGSQRVGELVKKNNAATRSIPPLLELGGSNAAIVLEDADLKMAARVITWGRFGIISCNNIKRVYAPKSVYWELLENLVAEARKLKISEKAPIPKGQEKNYTKFIDEYFNYLRSSKRAELLKNHCGSLQNLGILPVLDDISLSFLQEETFVPLLPVVCMNNEKAAIQAANYSNFDLGAVIFTKSKKKFERVSAQVEASTIVHNDAMIEFAIPSVPFGGAGKSGWGYVHGKEGLLEFVKFKTKIEERWLMPKLHLFPWTPNKVKFVQKIVDFVLNLS